MNIKASHHPVRKAIAALLVLAAFIFLAALVANSLGRLRTAEAEKPSTSQSSTSRFSFVDAAGWRRGPSSETSMALFSDAADDGTSQCFTSAEYYTGANDIESLHAQSSSELSGDGRTVTALGAEPMLLQTSSGTKPYMLHQYDIDTTSGAHEQMGGHAIGYIPLTDGYIKIYANCNHAYQLSTTTAALEAYRFD